MGIEIGNDAVEYARKVFAGEIVSTNDDLSKEVFKMYPNPCTKGGDLNFSGLESGDVISVRAIEGSTVLETNDALELRGLRLQSGSFIVSMSREGEIIFSDLLFVLD